MLAQTLPGRIGGACKTVWFPPQADSIQLSYGRDTSMLAQTLPRRIGGACKTDWFPPQADSIQLSYGRDTSMSAQTLPGRIGGACRTLRLPWQAVSNPPSGGRKCTVFALVPASALPSMGLLSLVVVATGGYRCASAHRPSFGGRARKCIHSAGFWH